MGCDIHCFLELRNENGRWEYFGELDLNRNYSLFSLLAGVRNYSNIVPIASPKGLPEDVSKGVSNESENWGSDGHSHSYIDLEDLLNFKIGYSGTKYSGLISKEQAEKLDKDGILPNSWCQGASSNLGYVYREWVNTTYNPLDHLLEEIKGKCGGFISSQEGFQYTNKDIRIVFWFDN